MPTFKEQVEIDAPDQVGLVVTGPVTGVGAGAQLTTTGTGGRGWEILATGQMSAQGQDKLNIRDLGNGQDVFTLTGDGKVGIGTTVPIAALTITAPDELGLSVSGPAGGVGAAITLGGGGGVAGGFPAVVSSQYWQLLATGQTAPQGSGKLNIASQRGGIGVPRSSVDVFTITGDGKVGVGTINPEFKLEVDAPDELGLHVAGPSAGVGAGISLSAVNAGTNINSWEILATGSNAAQGPGKLNIRNLITGEDIFSIFKGEVQVAGTLNVSVDIVLTGADFAEDFAVEASGAVEPGTVMVLDENAVLRASDKCYDKRVAGVISGAGNYKPGLILDRHESSSGRLPVALVGKVYCKVDATFGAIEVGDLLTTSPTRGHAMKATDSSKAFGAVIGKALRPLHSGKDLIPILVSLQ